MGSKYFIDTETCGLCGPAVLIQWAKDNGPIQLHEVWHSPIQETLELIEMLMSGDLIGFNLAFDMFQLAKLFTMLSLHTDYSECPVDMDRNILADMEEMGRWSDICIKPVRACDLMLHARKGPYQSTMDRKKIVIKKVPRALAFELAYVLEQRVVVSDIHFARRKDKKAPKWKVMDIKDGDDDFKNLVLKFSPSSALKALAVDALGEEGLSLFADVDPEIKPNELNYAPFAKAIGRSRDWNGAWPAIIHIHADHWRYYKPAREYAAKDIDLTRRLFYHFNSPEPGDDDSELACMVGVARWRGFAIDVESLKQKRIEALKLSKATPKEPRRVREYINGAISEAERIVIQGSTKKIVLEEIIKNPLWEGHPARERAQAVLNARKAQHEAKLYEKLIKAGRFHASFNVIGALSSRMSGTDGINPQGINKRKDIRACFTFADDGDVLSGGDFKSFEVTIAEAVYSDSDLRKELLGGRSIHAIFGTFCYPGKSYEEIRATDGTNNDLYTRSKSAVFAMLYGGEGYTLKTRLGISEEDANRAYQQFIRAYPGVGEARKRVFNMFCSMRQPGGIGTKIEWQEPADYIDTIMGFRRYFTLENKICKTLFNLAQRPPEPWKMLKVKVLRRDREQTTMGATQSALYAAAFALQAANMRAANNHVIQSTGATITKAVQRAIWDLQPSGINPWLVRPFNVHDELQCVHKPEMDLTVKYAIELKVKEFTKQVPLLEIGWKQGLKSWADK